MKPESCVAIRGFGDPPGQIADGRGLHLTQLGDLGLRESGVLQVDDPLFPCEHASNYTDFRKASNGQPYRFSVVMGPMKRTIEYTGLDKRLAALREASGKTLGEVAKASGLTPGTLSDLEHDRQRGSKQLYALAKFYGVQFEWLSTGKGEKEPEKPVNRIEDTPGIYIQHGYKCTPDGARLGSEWDKIEGDEYRQLVHDFVFGMVAAQQRAARPAQVAVMSSPKVSIRRSRGHSPRKPTNQ